MNTYESQLLDWMRYPLILGVIFVHTYQPFMPLVQWSGDEVGSSFNNLIFGICSSFCVLAVPIFFVISGYLFFWGIERFDFQTYLYKLRKRVSSLLIPYFIWCLLPMWPVLRKLVGMLIHWHGPEQLWPVLNKFSLAAVFWNAGGGMPMNSPLWFVRDLIILAVISPVIYYYLRYTNRWGLGALIAFSLTCFYKHSQGLTFQVNSVLFFSMGAYFSIHKNSLFMIADRYKWFSFLALPMLILSLIFGTKYTELPFVLLSLPFAFWFPYRLFSNGDQINTILSKSVFFIYSTHEVICLPYIVKALSPYWGMHWWMDLLLYFTPPITTMLLLTLVYFVLARIVPRTMRVLVGR